MPSHLGTIPGWEQPLPLLRSLRVGSQSQAWGVRHLSKITSDFRALQGPRDQSGAGDLSGSSTSLAPPWSTTCGPSARGCAGMRWGRVFRLLWRLRLRLVMILVGFG